MPKKHFRYIAVAPENNMSHNNVHGPKITP